MHPESPRRVYRLWPKHRRNRPVGDHQPRRKSGDHAAPDPETILVSSTDVAGGKKPSYPMLRFFSRIGCLMGHAPSMVLLGAVYESGAVPGRDIESANALYLRAAAKGNVQAMWRLGVNYTGGKGGEANNTEAVYWLRRAAEGGHEMAAWALGKMHLAGRLVEQDLVEGIRYLQQAATAGSTEARKNLADIYREGRYGVPPDAAEAQRWLDLASTNE